MALNLELQSVWSGPTPDHSQFHHWASMALIVAGESDIDRDLCVRVEDRAAMTLLNERYRKKSGPTNVLSFHFDWPSDMPNDDIMQMLGDLVLCGPLVWSEAWHAGKPINEHWALLTAHGVLHLLGYDHEQDEEWHRMASLENDILARLGMVPPYAPALLRRPVAMP